MKKGICCAGNMIVDITYPIETWPNQNELTHITEGITNSAGGAVCNVLADLARLDDTLPLQASGFAGEVGSKQAVDLAWAAVKEAYPYIHTGSNS